MTYKLAVDWVKKNRVWIYNQSTRENKDAISLLKIWEQVPVVHEKYNGELTNNICQLVVSLREKKGVDDLNKCK